MARGLHVKSQIQSNQQILPDSCLVDSALQIELPAADVDAPEAMDEDEGQEDSGPDASSQVNPSQMNGACCVFDACMLPHTVQGEEKGTGWPWTWHFILWPWHDMSSCSTGPEAHLSGQIIPAGSCSRSFQTCTD